VPIRARTWDWWHIACLWVGMSVCIPTYMLAAGLMSNGMSWKAALLTILVGNAIVLVPMILNAHAGTKYGVPFPVLIRSSFGVTGAHIPSILRGLVACGWFGIQTWIGGFAIYVMIKTIWPGIEHLGAGMVPAFVGINGGELLCFLFFWALHMAIVWAGVDSIKKVEAWAAPILIAIGIALGVWAYQAGGGFFKVLDASSHFATPDLVAVRQDDAHVRLKVDLLLDASGHPRATGLRFASAATMDEAKTRLSSLTFQRPEREIVFFADAAEAVVAVELERAGVAGPVLEAAIEPAGGKPASNWWLVVFLPLLTAMVGYWATLSLNIPDFTRYAKSQKDQMIGQALGLPTTMTGYAFIGVFATCASLIVFPDILVASQAPWDPVKLLERFREPWIVVLSMFGLALATISTNVAANVVAPAVGFSNLAPHRISFKMGGYITGIIGLVMMPWKLLATAGAYIFTWLLGYSALLGGIAGVMLADYYLLRRARVDLLDLYRPEGRYRGINKAGIVAFTLGVLLNLPGFLAQVELVNANAVPEVFKTLYTYAWFVSFAVALVAYLLLIKVWPVDTSTREVLEG
jgi:cytosine/uracil/thiamine/allantoin permease